MEELTDFARGLAKEGEIIEIAYTDNPREEIIKTIKRIAQKEQDPKARKFFQEYTKRMQNVFSGGDIAAASWKSKKVISYSLSDANLGSNHMFIMIDKNYTNDPMALRSTIAHEFYERDWNETEKRENCLKAMIATVQDNALLAERLVIPKFFSGLTSTIFNDITEFIIDRKVEQDFPREYFASACLELKNNRQLIETYKKGIIPADMVYILTEFIAVLETNTRSFPVEKDSRQIKSSLDKIRDLKRDCIASYSESNHPVFGLSEKISKNLESVPHNQTVSSMYSVFNNFFNTFNGFLDDVTSIERRRRRKRTKIEI